MTHRQAYCSWCFTRSLHVAEVPPRRLPFQPIPYRCRHCGQPTLPCLVSRCPHMAQAGEEWMNQLCAVHLHLLEDFSVLQQPFRSLLDYPKLVGKRSRRSRWGVLRPMRQFSILPIHPGKGPAVVIIDGFLTERAGIQDLDPWREGLNVCFPRQPWYYLRWESRTQADLGRILGPLVMSWIRPSYTFTGRLNPVLLARDVAYAILTNPWMKAMVRAAQAGMLLGILMGQIPRGRFILLGHSLGARVIFYALRTLAFMGKRKVVQAHLLGGVVGERDPKVWRILTRAVEEYIVNYYSRNDRILRYIFRATHFQSPIGLAPIRGRIPGIRNRDVSAWIQEHSAYKRQLARIFWTPSRKPQRNRSASRQTAVQPTV